MRRCRHRSERLAGRVGQRPAAEPVAERRANRGTVADMWSRRILSMAPALVASCPRQAAALISCFTAALACTTVGKTPLPGATAARNQPLPDRQAIAITDVTIIDVEHQGSLGPRTVLIDSGRIVAITAPREARIPAAAQRITGRGRFLIPGLVDMHVHLFNHASRRPPNDWSFPLFIASGVTALREMNAQPADLAAVQRWRAALDGGVLVAPRIVAAGVAVHGRSPRDAAHLVDVARDAGADFIKIYSELPVAHWQVSSARRGYGRCPWSAMSPPVSPCWTPPRRACAATST